MFVFAHQFELNNSIHVRTIKRIPLFVLQNKKKFSMSDDFKYNPIHTVSAPNLNKNLAYTTHGDYIHEPDNQIFEQKEHFNQITFRPLTVEFNSYILTAQTK